MRRRAKGLERAFWREVGAPPREFVVDNASGSCRNAGSGNAISREVLPRPAIAMGMP
jgi:hypothetical protein